MSAHPIDFGNLSLQEADMARRRGQRLGHLYHTERWWFLQFYDHTKSRTVESGPNKGKEVPDRPTVRIGAYKGPGALTEKQAQRLAWDLHLSKIDRRVLAPMSMQTVAEFVEARFEPDVVYSLKKSGQEHYAYVLDKHVLPALGAMQLGEVTPVDVQRLLKSKLDAGLSVQTALHVKNAISAIFRHAKAMQAHRGDLPTEGVRLPPLRAAERQALTWDQAKIVAGFMGGKKTRADLEALVIVLAVTGLRIGEATGLRWRWVNLEDHPVVVDGELIPAYTIAVREAFVRGEVVTLKTKASRRNIPMSAEVWVQLSRVLQVSQFTGPAHPVWANREGKHRDRHALGFRYLKPAAKKAGVPWVSWHTFRHTSATLADQAGMSVTERQRVLGHAASAITMHYTHVEIEQVRSKMEGIGKPN